MDCSLPGSSIHGNFQARVLEWVAISFSTQLKQLTSKDYLSSNADGGLVAKSYLTLCNPMEYSPPGSSIHGNFQARVLEWGAIAFGLYEYARFQ